MKNFKCVRNWNQYPDLTCSSSSCKKGVVSSCFSITPHTQPCPSHHNMHPRCTDTYARWRDPASNQTPLISAFHLDAEGWRDFHPYQHGMSKVNNPIFALTLTRGLGFVSRFLTKQVECCATVLFLFLFLFLAALDPWDNPCGSSSLRIVHNKHYFRSGHNAHWEAKTRFLRSKVYFSLRCVSSKLGDRDWPIRLPFPPWKWTKEHK